MTGRHSEATHSGRFLPIFPTRANLLPPTERARLSVRPNRTCASVGAPQPNMRVCRCAPTEHARLPVRPNRTQAENIRIIAMLWCACVRLGILGLCVCSVGDPVSDVRRSRLGLSLRSGRRSSLTVASTGRRLIRLRPRDAAGRRLMRLCLRSSMA